MAALGEQFPVEVGAVQMWIMAQAAAASGLQSMKHQTPTIAAAVAMLAGVERLIVLQVSVRLVLLMAIAQTRPIPVQRVYVCAEVVGHAPPQENAAAELVCRNKQMIIIAAKTATMGQKSGADIDTLISSAIFLYQVSRSSARFILIYSNIYDVHASLLTQ